jgi:hypothetical protein
MTSHRANMQLVSDSQCGDGVALGVITHPCLSRADAGFTEEIILERAKSLRDDLNLDERSQLVRAFSKAIGI